MWAALGVFPDVAVLRLKGNALVFKVLGGIVCPLVSFRSLVRDAEEERQKEARDPPAFI